MQQKKRKVMLAIALAPFSSLILSGCRDATLDDAKRWVASIKIFVDTTATALAPAWPTKARELAAIQDMVDKFAVKFAQVVDNAGKQDWTADAPAVIALANELLSLAEITFTTLPAREAFVAIQVVLIAFNSFYTKTSHAAIPLGIQSMSGDPEINNTAQRAIESAPDKRLLLERQMATIQNWANSRPQ